MQMSPKGPDYTGLSILIACGMWVASMVVFSVCLLLLKGCIDPDSNPADVHLGALPTIAIFGGYLWGMNRLSKKVLVEKKRSSFQAHDCLRAD